MAWLWRPPGQRNQDVRRSLPAWVLRSGKAAHDQAIDPRREGCRIVGHLAVENLCLVEQQLGKIGDLVVARIELGVARPP